MIPKITSTSAGACLADWAILVIAVSVSVWGSYRSRSAMMSPTRSALAIAVSEGFTAPMLGKKLVSTT